MKMVIFRTVKASLAQLVNCGVPPIHVSVFGTAFAQRLITQLYFEGDPRSQQGKHNPRQVQLMD